jgi:hypothetical protein
VITSNLDPLRNGKISGEADGILVRFENDQLLTGSAALLRKSFRTPGRRTYVPVIIPISTRQ